MPPISPFGNLFLGLTSGSERLALYKQIQQLIIFGSKVKLSKSIQFIRLSMHLMHIKLFQLPVIMIDQVYTTLKKKKSCSYQQLTSNLLESQQSITFSYDNIITLVYKENIVYQINTENEKNLNYKVNHFYFPKQILQAFDVQNQILILTNDMILQKIVKETSQLLRRISARKLKVYDTKRSLLKNSIIVGTFAFANKGQHSIIKFAEISNYSDKLKRYKPMMKKLPHQLYHKIQIFQASSSLNCIKLRDIQDIQNPSLKFILLGSSSNERFSADSKYFYRQIKNQLKYLEIEKFRQEEITYKKLDKIIIGMKIFQEKDHITQLILVSLDNIYHYDIDLEKLIEIQQFESVKIFEFSEASKIFAYSIDQKEIGKKNIYILHLKHLEIHSSILEAHNDILVSISFSLNELLLLSRSQDCVKILDLQFEWFIDCLYITNVLKKEQKKKKQKLIECLRGENQIGCIKEFSQQPLLQKSNCQQQNLTINLVFPSLVALFEQKK